MSERVHKRDCPLLPDYPDHSGWCPNDQNQLNDYWDAWAWARSREVEIRIMLDRTREYAHLEWKEKFDGSNT